MGHNVYPDGSCRVYVRKLSCEVLNSHIKSKIVNAEAPVITVIVNRIPKQTLCELIMEGYKRSYVQCRSGRLAGSLIHTVMPGRRNSSANNPQAQKATNLETVVNLDATDENIKEFFMKKRCTVVIKNSPAVQEVFDNVPKLRKRKLQNYAELSMSPMDAGNKIEKHVPIYRQMNPKARKERTKSDLYEFDSDSEKVKKKRRRRFHSSADNSVGFEEGMKDIMRVIEKNFKRNQAGQRKKIKKNGTVPTAQQIMKLKTNEKQFPYNTSTAQNNVIQRQLLNEEVELLSTTQDNVNPPETETNVVDINEDAISYNPRGFQRLDARPAMEEIIENKTGSQSHDFHIETKDKISDNLEIIDGIFDEDTEHNDFFGFSDESQASPPKTKDNSANSVRLTTEIVGFDIEALPKTKHESTNSIRPTAETLDFDFNSKSTESFPKTKDKSPNRINIISNIIINPKSYKDFHQPNANSTMVLPRRPKRAPSPWRPDLGITRNPYLLQFKDTLLPNYNQEMVLNSTISDKTCLDVSKTPTKSTETPKTHQTSILKYFNGTKRNHELEVLRESSLFDDGDFSPIKSVRGQVDEDKENLSPRKTSTAIKKIRRDILGENAAANRMPLSPLQNLTNYSKQTSQEDIEDYFGFTSVIEEDKENGPMKPKKAMKIYFNKPVRFGDVLKQTVKNSVHVEGEFIAKEPVPVEDDVVKNKVHVERESVSDLPMRLFEDLDDNKTPMRKYPPKRVRRPRRPSLVSENSDDENHQHKNKKRNARTREEEEEFERWAVAFNSMCQEVDEHALEIE